MNKEKGVTIDAIVLNTGKVGYEHQNFDTLAEILMLVVSDFVDIQNSGVIVNSNPKTTILGKLQALQVRHKYIHFIGHMKSFFLLQNRLVINTAAACMIITYL